MRVRRGAGRKAGGGGRPRRTQLAGEGATADWGRARGGAHDEHAVHGRDAGGVEAQRLVERTRPLPRVEQRGIRCGARCGLGGGRRRVTAVHAACRGGLDCRSGARHGEERT
eukprot:scaffold45743_cov95-Phaeocystis_antarctica.AAC.1